MHPMAAHAALLGVRVYRRTDSSTEWHPCRLFGPAGVADHEHMLAYHPKHGWAGNYAYGGPYVEVGFDDVPDEAWARLTEVHLAHLDIR